MPPRLPSVFLESTHPLLMQFTTTILCKVMEYSFGWRHYNDYKISLFLWDKLSKCVILDGTQCTASLFPTLFLMALICDSITNRILQSMFEGKLQSSLIPSLLVFNIWITLGLVKSAFYDWMQGPRKTSAPENQVGSLHTIHLEF